MDWILQRFELYFDFKNSLFTLESICDAFTKDRMASTSNANSKFCLRSSITLIDVPSNRHCFNDGYHTSHHLNPRRHWRDHPLTFINAKTTYATQQALVFQNIDYIMMTVTLLRKDYMHLASCLVPIGDQIGMTQVEIADMLKRKTKKFEEADIWRKWGKVQ